MVALPRKPASFFNQQLIELLDERDHPCRVNRWLEFGDRLDALEAEALAHCAPDQTLILIRIAREVVDFAEQVVMRSGRRPEPVRLVEVLSSEPRLGGESRQRSSDHNAIA